MSVNKQQVSSPFRSKTVDQHEDKKRSKRNKIQMMTLPGRGSRQLPNLLPKLKVTTQRPQRSSQPNLLTQSTRQVDARLESTIGTFSSSSATGSSSSSPMPPTAAKTHRLLTVSSSEPTLHLTATGFDGAASFKKPAKIAFEGGFTGDFSKLPTLLTGNDAVAYFAKNNDQTPLKFVQLNRAPDWNRGKNWKPYDLVVVQPGETVDKEYFVFSSKGVMRFVHDTAQDKVAKLNREVVPTETLTLARFLFESTIFGMLRHRSTFKNYLIWKMLHAWKSSVRFAQFCRTRDKIQKRLFCLKNI